jgi:hypothetical protein
MDANWFEDSTLDIDPGRLIHKLEAYLQPRSKVHGLECVFSSVVRVGELGNPQQNVHDEGG